MPLLLRSVPPAHDHAPLVLGLAVDGRGFSHARDGERELGDARKVATETRRKAGGATVTTTEPASPASSPGAPRWLQPSLDVREGRDPLGLQTTTQDRLTPVLLPGILELSRRARYFSFHAWLLHTFRERRFSPDSATLSGFIKAREWDYGLAVLRCPHGCGSSPVGAQSLRPLAGQPGPYPRGESVKSAFGGYGLYYRSPMAELGLVARSGTLLGENPIPVDVLYDTERSRRLVETFTAAVTETAYVQHWMFTSDPLPAKVLEELADAACLCQLRSRSEERSAVHAALFTVDEHSSSAIAAAQAATEDGVEVPALVLDAEAAVAQRRRSIAHYLALVQENPKVVNDVSAFREALWSPPKLRSHDHTVVAGQWSGLVAKDVWQDSLCSIWAEFVKAGLSATRASDADGLTWDETRDLARSLVKGPPTLDAAMPTADLAAAIAAGQITLPGVIDPNLAEAPLEALRVATVKLSTVASGLVALLELHRRAYGRTESGWTQTATVRSVWQPSVAEVLAALHAHLADAPTVADTLWWLVERFVITVHERIAYSKLPEDTFRFRWEDGRVRFYDNGIGRFPLAAIRHDPLALITRDLGFWDYEEDGAKLTSRGVSFIAEVFG